MNLLLSYFIFVVVFRSLTNTGNWLILFALISIGCKVRPYSREQIYVKADDHLTLQDKVTILKASSSVEDDALQASIANLYAQNGNWYQAKTSISKAVKLNPLEPSYHLSLAHYYVELNSPELAYNEAKIAHDLNAYDPNLDALLAKMAIETADSVEGASFVKRYYSANPQSSEAQLLMARLDLFEQNFYDAKKLVEQGLHTDSLNEQGWLTAFQVNNQLQDYENAELAGFKLIKLDSVNVNYYKQLAYLFEQKGDDKQAAHYYFETYKLEPDLKLLRNKLEFELSNGRYDSVLYYTDSLVAGSNYDSSYILLERARAFEKRYKYDDSHALYTRLWKRDTTDSVVLAERAIVQRKIAYLQRKKQEQKRLADSLANAMPTINF